MTVGRTDVDGLGLWGRSEHERRWVCDGRIHPTAGRNSKRDRSAGRQWVNHVNLRDPDRSGKENIVIQGRRLDGNRKAARNNTESGTALGAIIDVRTDCVEKAAVRGDVDHPAV